MGRKDKDKKAAAAAAKKKKAAAAQAEEAPAEAEAAPGENSATYESQPFFERTGSFLVSEFDCELDCGGISELIIKR